MTFPGVSDGKESASNAGDLDLIPGLRGSPGEGNGNPFQYFCLENSMDRGAWRATIHGVTKSQTLSFREVSLGLRKYSKKLLFKKIFKLYLSAPGLPCSTHYL